MAGRYLVTGVQLGMLKAFYNCDVEEGKRMISEILEDQYVGTSNKMIETDVKIILESGLIHEDGDRE